MKIPNGSNALIDPRKITHYLLDPSHPVGGSKAAFFTRFGFSKSEWHDLAGQLIRHVADNDVVTSARTPHGIRYAVDGTILAPDGTSLNIRSAWFIGIDSTSPRLITAHPLPKS